MRIRKAAAHGIEQRRRVRLDGGSWRGILRTRHRRDSGDEKSAGEKFQYPHDRLPTSARARHCPALCASDFAVDCGILPDDDQRPRLRGHHDRADCSAFAPPLRRAGRSSAHRETGSTHTRL